MKRVQTPAQERQITACQCVLKRRPSTLGWWRLNYRPMGEGSCQRRVAKESLTNGHGGYSRQQKHSRETRASTSSCGGGCRQWVRAVAEASCAGCQTLWQNWGWVSVVNSVSDASLRV